MKKAITVLGLGACAMAMSVGHASAMDNDNAEATTAVNLREQPSATSGKVSQIQEGAKVTVIDSKDGWTNVKTEDGREGWVSGYYVSSDEEKKAAEQKADSANVNADSKTDNIDTQDAQNQVTPNTQNSYQKENVKEDAVNQAPEQSEETSVSSNGKIHSTSALNLRVGPSTSNQAVGAIYKGEIFKVLSQSSNGWYKVQLADGKVGWASGKYINLTSDVDKSNVDEYTSPKEAPEANQNSNYGTVNSSVGLNVRSGAGTKNSVLTTLAYNSKVNIIGEENGWLKVKLDNGQVGYVGASYINKSQATSSNGVSEAPATDNTSSKVSDSKSVSATGNKVVDFAQTLIGTRYSWGGTTTAGFDCSGFTQYVYKNVLGVNIPRVSRAQATTGKAVSMNNLQAGDLLYFDTTGSGSTSHVGIYMGNGKFIHASGTATNPEYVKVSSMSENWVKCLGARRI